MGSGTCQGNIDRLTGLPSYHGIHVGGSGRVIDEAFARIGTAREEWRGH